MIKRNAVTLAILAVFLIAGVIACQPPGTDSPRLRIEDARARPASAGNTSAVYMTVINAGGASDTLLSVRSDVAESIELHETKMENDVMRMRPVNRVEVPANGRVEFKPGGLHVMLIGLRQDLQPGDQFEVILVCEKSGEIPVRVEVASGF